MLSLPKWLPWSTVSRSMDHKASTWFLPTAQMAKMVHGYSRVTDPDKTLRGSRDHRHQHDFSLQHRPQASALPLVATHVTHNNMVPRDSTSYRNQYDFVWRSRPQTATWPSVVTRVTDINTDPAASELWHQTWPLAAAQTQISP